MTKLGTPIGAGPKVATVRPGFRAVGLPSGLRRMGCVIFCPSSITTSFGPLPFFFSLAKMPLPPPLFFLPALVVPPEVLLPEAPDPPLPVLPPPEPPPEPPPPVEPPPIPGNGLVGRGLVGSGLVGGGLTGSGFVGRGTVGTVTVRPPTVIELAVPAPAIASAVPRAMMTRSLFAIRGQFLP